MLNREECERAYKTVEDVFYIEFCPEEAERENIERPSWDDFVKSMDLLEKMIMEHFDNPPLKFEELKEGMFVWDNKKHTYIQIEKITESFMKNIFFNQIGWECCEHMGFEPNRFYRKEVQE